MADTSMKRQDTKASGFRKSDEDRGSNSCINSTSVNSGKKCQVYIHNFDKYQRSSSSFLCQEGSSLHQHMYRHEIDSHCDAKLRGLKYQFDNLSLSCNKPLQGSSHQKTLPVIGFHGQNIFREKFDSSMKPKNSVNSTAMSRLHKLFLYKPERKAAIDKLEETYWSKWKPKKENRNAKPKLKVGYVRKAHEVPSFESKAITKKGSQETIQPQRQESGDSKETEITEHRGSDLQVYLKFTESESDSLKSEGKQDYDQDEIVTEQVVEEAYNVETEQNDEETTTLDVKTEDAESVSVNNIKHTDSIILMTKKQKTGRSQRFQQPKCIRLFKRVGYSSSTPIRFIRGGSYPLKSCLKTSKSARSPSPLGRPGSPIGLLGSRGSKRR